MDAPFHSAGKSRLPVESRLFPRKPVLFASVQVSGDSAGLILNISEGGLCVQTVREIAGNGPVQLRFQSLQSDGWVETQGRIIWRNEAKTVAGIAFVGLAPGAQKEVRTWLSFGNSLQELRGNWAGGRAMEVRPIESSPFTAVAETQKQLAALLDSSQPEGSTATRQKDDSDISGRHAGDELPISDALTHPHRIAALAIAAFLVLLAVWTAQRAHLVRHAAELLSKRSVSSHQDSVSPEHGSAIPEVSKSAATRVPSPPATAASASVPQAPNPSTRANPSAGTEPVKQFVLQVAAMSEEGNANQLSESLRPKNFPAFVSKRDGDRLYKVMVGPYSDENELRAAKAALQKDGIEPIVKRWTP